MIRRAFTLGLIQMRVTGGALAENLSRAERMVGEAAGKGADVVVLPECLDLGWTDPSSLEQADAIPGGEACARLAEAATEHGVYLCGGITERAGDAVYNSAILIGPDGALLHRHRKINELEIGQPFYAKGQGLGVVETPFGNFGVMICADGFARGQNLSRSLCEMGADMILSPGAWAVPANHDQEQQPYGDVWRDCYVPVAKDYQTWIVGVSNVGPITGGPWSGRKCIGCSLVIGPDGEEVLQGPYGEDAETVLTIRAYSPKSV